MPATFDYPAAIARDEDGRHVVTFPDFGWGASDGASRAEALAEARDLLRELIATTMREGRTLPQPSPCHRPVTDLSRACHGPVMGLSRACRSLGAVEERLPVAPPVQIALKAAFYQAWRQTGMSQRRLACELGIAESEARRMLSPDHATGAATLDDALRRFGKCVTLSVGEAV